MRIDVITLEGVRHRSEPPTLRFFRFASPSVTFGRLQKISSITSSTPEGWTAIQRPTGGGLVFHQNDLCLSLCWPRGQSPLPLRPQDQYRWIHGVILKAIGSGLRMADCCDSQPAREPFEIRQCFNNPVGYDLMRGKQKIVGGALSCHKEATLYQGSIANPPGDLQARLRNIFEDLLH